MIIKLWGAMALSASLTVLLALSGCGDDNPNEIATTSAPNVAGKGGPPPGGAPPSNPKIKAIMSVIGKRPKDLQKTLTNSLKQDAPAWDTIQPQAAEYSKLATELGTLEPTKGEQGFVEQADPRLRRNSQRARQGRPGQGERQGRLGDR